MGSDREGERRHPGLSKSRLEISGAFMATNRLTRRQFVVALTLPALLRTSGVGAQTGRTTLSLATAGPGLKLTVVTDSPADLVQKLLAREIDAFWYGAGLPSPPFVEIASTASRPGRASESQQHSFLARQGRCDGVANHTGRIRSGQRDA